jgi:hypothetical protein
MFKTLANKPPSAPLGDPTPGARRIASDDHSDSDPEPQVLQGDEAYFGFKSETASVRTYCGHGLGEKERADSMIIKDSVEVQLSLT